MAKFKPNPDGIRKLEQQAKRALNDLVHDVTRTHAGASAATVRQALVAGAQKRGLRLDPKPELVKRITDAPKQ